MIVLIHLINPCSVWSSIEETPFLTTLKACSGVFEITPQNEETQNTIRALSYPQQRALRAFCVLPDINSESASMVLEKLKTENLAFDTILLLDYFTGLPGVTIPLCWQFIETVSDKSLFTSKILSSIKHLFPPDAPSLLPLIVHTQQLGESGQWAAKALFEIDQIPFKQVLTGISILDEMSSSQQWATEQFLKTIQVKNSTTLKGLETITKLSTTAAWNVRALFQEPAAQLNLAYHMLFDFTPLPVTQQEIYFKTLHDHEKQLLLNAFDQAQENIIRHINDLHAVTNSLGREIGAGGLKNLSFEQLFDLFEKLELQDQKTWADRMAAAQTTNQKSDAIKLLRQATAQARKDAAMGLTAANIYTLLARGNTLYTSSFRNILVPELKRRINGYYGNDLLTFLLTVDPGNRFSSQFITNLAWKGSLLLFLPKKSDEQKQVIDLVAASAFQDEYSLLLFSATFADLLKKLTPQARAHLIDLMLTRIERDDLESSEQLRIILQHYLSKQPRLISSADRAKIKKMIVARGELDLHRFNRTPFPQWREDKALQSLSIFQRDDDGQISFYSFCLELLSNGYQPAFSKDFSSVSLESAMAEKFRSILNSIQPNKTYPVTQLFRLMAKQAVIVDWTKKLNSIKITHSIAVFQNESHQQNLLTQFLKNGHELFAQRGHSYWRRHQLLTPMAKVLESGAVEKMDLLSKQRFLSLGSCGGIKAYLQLGKLFRNKVDILATIGTGTWAINNPYNRKLFEIIATRPAVSTWEEVSVLTAEIFKEAGGKEYLQPGSLPAILYKTMYSREQHHGTD